MIQRMVARLLTLLLLTSPLAGQTAARAPEGNFELGDQILLEVEGDSQFTHVFAVGPGPALTLPVIGAIPLSGVRRANVETYLGQQLARYMKNPMVHAKVLVRLGVLHLAKHAQPDEHLRVYHGVLHVARELLPEVRLHVGTPHAAERDRADDRKRERGSRSHGEDMS